MTYRWTDPAPPAVQAQRQRRGVTLQRQVDAYRDRQMQLCNIQHNLAMATDDEARAMWAEVLKAYA